MTGVFVVSYTLSEVSNRDLDWTEVGAWGELCIRMKREWLIEV